VVHCSVSSTFAFSDTEFLSTCAAQSSFAARLLACVGPLSWPIWLIVMRDKLDRKRKTYLPWKEDYFRHRVAEIRSFAGIDPAAKFMGLCHGGNTECADANLPRTAILGRVLINPA
jgi:hypothetical protein